MARISSGKISLMVRYAELAPAEAKKKMTDQAIVWVVASSTPRVKRKPVMASRMAESAYVAAIIGRRPTVSKKRPRSRGPRKLPAAKGSKYNPTTLDDTP